MVCEAVAEGEDDEVWEAAGQQGLRTHGDVGHADALHSCRREVVQLDHAVGHWVHKLTSSECRDVQRLRATQRRSTAPCSEASVLIKFRVSSACLLCPSLLAMSRQSLLTTPNWRNVL